MGPAGAIMGQTRFSVGCGVHRSAAKKRDQAQGLARKGLRKTEIAYG